MATDAKPKKEKNVFIQHKLNPGIHPMELYDHMGQKTNGLVVKFKLWSVFCVTRHSSEQLLQSICVALMDYTANCQWCDVVFFLLLLLPLRIMLNNNKIALMTRHCERDGSFFSLLYHKSSYWPNICISSGLYLQTPCLYMSLMLP